MSIGPDEERRIRHDERAQLKALQVDSLLAVINDRLATIDRRLIDQNHLREEMMTKPEFARFESRMDGRYQEFFQQARNNFVQKREVAEERKETGQWRQEVWVRVGIAVGVIVGLITVIQAAILTYLTLKH